MRSTAALISFVLLASGAQAQSHQEDEPSVRCGKLAAERFARDWREHAKANFANHYNVRLQKCFYLEDTAFYDGSQKISNLLDLLENKVIGTYDKIEGESFVLCSVQGKRCASEGEWKALIKPLMED
jgi:hypothetical protein